MKVEDLKKELDSSLTVGFHKFVLLSKGRVNDLFCFFEGYDSPYYSTRIKEVFKGNYHPIICGNKKSVLYVAKTLETNVTYSKYKKLFFVDKDFDPSLSIKNIYETPCYSIENFYSNEFCLKEVLKNEFKLNEDDNQFTEILNLFKEEQKSFHDSTLLFNSWYATLKKKKAETGAKINVSLSDAFPKNFVCIKIGSISSDYDIDKIRKTFPDALDVKEEEIRAVQEAFAKQDCSKAFRGKYQLSFFYEFLQYIINDANNSKKILKSKTKFKVDKAIIISQLSQYALTPDCLLEYIKKFS